MNVTQYDAGWIVLQWGEPFASRSRDMVYALSRISIGVSLSPVARAIYQEPQRVVLRGMIGLGTRCVEAIKES